LEPRSSNTYIPSAVAITVADGRERLLNYIRRRVRREEDAEDILQDVLHQLVEAYNIAEPIERVTAWLFRVARNRITDWYRKKRTATFSDLKPAAGDEESLNLEDILFDPDQNPDELFARSLVWPALADALDELPEEQRDAFVLHELEGKSFKEIAEMTGEPISTLLSRKRYAVLFLRERLRELYDELQHS